MSGFWTAGSAGTGPRITSQTLFRRPCVEPAVDFPPHLEPVRITSTTTTNSRFPRLSTLNTPNSHKMITFTCDVLSQLGLPTEQPTHRNGEIPTTAAARIFNTTELLEMILSHSSHPDLTHFERINSTFYRTIKESPSLGLNMFIGHDSTLYTRLPIKANYHDTIASLPPNTAMTARIR